MSLPPVPNTQIKSDNVWLGWFRRIQEILNRWIIIVGSSVVIGRFNQGTTFPALELTRSTDTNGFTTLEFSNAAGLRRLELVANGTTGAYGAAANESVVNAQTGLVLSVNDIAGMSLDSSRRVLLNGDVPEINFRSRPSLGNGLRIHLNNGAAVAVIDSTFPLLFRNGAGSTVTMTIDSARGTVRLNPLAADPISLSDGEMWYNSTAGKFRGRAAGVTVDFH